MALRDVPTLGMYGFFMQGNVAQLYDIVKYL